MKYIFEGFALIVQGFVDMFSWNQIPRKKHKIKKYNLKNKFIRDYSEPLSDKTALMADQQNIKKDFEKVLGKPKNK